MFNSLCKHLPETTRNIRKLFFFFQDSTATYQTYQSTYCKFMCGNSFFPLTPSAKPLASNVWINLNPLSFQKKTTPTEIQLNNFFDFPIFLISWFPLYLFVTHVGTHHLSPFSPNHRVPNCDTGFTALRIYLLKRSRPWVVESPMDGFDGLFENRKSREMKDTYPPVKLT